MRVKFANHYNPEDSWVLDTIEDIIAKVKAYGSLHSLDINMIEIENTSYTDVANNRYDISIKYNNEKSQPISQKLLYLKGDIVDGKTLHANFEKYYPKEPDELDKEEDYEEER